MRVSSSMLAAGFAATAFAAPPHKLMGGKLKASERSVSATPSGDFKFFGVSVSGAEFGQGNVPGTLGKDYIFPDTAAIQKLMDLGMNSFRIPFLMERLAQGTMTAEFNAAYLADLKKVVDFITAAGSYAIVDPHNFGRYNGNIISSTADFQTFWTNLATVFKDDSKVVFDCINEPHDMSTATQTAELMQACIDGVRGAGATSQYIFVEGTSYSGAWTWTTSGNSENMGNLTDTVDDLLVYEMHQYLDSDGSGTSATCVSTTIGQERVEAATAWLKANNKKGVIGEFAGGANADCQTAVDGMLSYLSDNTDVWMGALWWGGGPWWGQYIYSMEPPSGIGYVAYKDLLAKYVPSSA